MLLRNPIKGSFRLTCLTAQTTIDVADQKANSSNRSGKRYGVPFYAPLRADCSHFLMYMTDGLACMRRRRSKVVKKGDLERKIARVKSFLEGKEWIQLMAKGNGEALCNAAHLAFGLLVVGKHKENYDSEVDAMKKAGLNPERCVTLREPPCGVMWNVTVIKNMITNFP